MLRSNQIVIADTSVLIILSKINELSILKDVFDKITVTDKVAEEYKGQLPEWVDIQPIDVEAYRAIAELVDEGEASAIALALRNINSLLILDDIRARKYAKKLGLKVMGTLGVIAKAEGVLTFRLTRDFECVFCPVKATVERRLRRAMRGARPGASHAAHRSTKATQNGPGRVGVKRAESTV